MAVTALSILTLSACGGGASDDASNPSVVDPTPTDGSQSKSQLDGYGYSCVLMTSGFGTAMSSASYDRYIQLNADGTYDFSSHIYSNGNCSGGHGGGVGVAQVNSSGTWDVGGTNTTPSTATKINFHTNATLYFTVYHADSDALAQKLVTWANACIPGGHYTNATTSGYAFVPGTSCPATGNVDLGTPGTPGGAEYNIAYRSGATLQTGTPLNGIWSLNAGTYPTSYSTTWVH